MTGYHATRHGRLSARPRCPSQRRLWALPVTAMDTTASPVGFPSRGQASSPTQSPAPLSHWNRLSPVARPEQRPSLRSPADISTSGRAASPRRRSTSASSPRSASRRASPAPPRASQRCSRRRTRFSLGFRSSRVGRRQLRQLAGRRGHSRLCYVCRNGTRAYRRQHGCESLPTSTASHFLFSLSPSHKAYSACGHSQPAALTRALLVPWPLQARRIRSLDSRPA